MGNPEQRCSKDGNYSGSFITIVLTRSQNNSKTTDKVPFQFFLLSVHATMISEKDHRPFDIATSFMQVAPGTSSVGCNADVRNVGKGWKEEMEKFEFFQRRF